ncbi:MAG: tRNA (adenosine(37)-N6)-dimethylallyltransferase MiaA [Patescibacteria group bacterium]
MARPRIIAIVGSTASGKSALAVRMAQKFNGEIISADSRQIYTGLDIGTGKITHTEMHGIPHYCIDIVSPKKIFTVDEYRIAAEKIIADIYSRGTLPIIAGGTGFYIDAILYGASYPQIPPNWDLREKLEKQQTAVLFKTLAKLDPHRASTIDPNNRRRIIRSIEIIKAVGWMPSLIKKHRFDSLIIGIKTNPTVLRKKITKRLMGWLKEGLVEEVEKLHKNQKLPWRRFEELVLDYKYVALYLQGKMTREEMIARTDTEIWHYAKRQLTYFKKMENVHWVNSAHEAERLVKDFLN